MRGIGDTTDNVEGARSTLFRDETALPAIPQIARAVHNVRKEVTDSVSQSTLSECNPRLVTSGFHNSPVLG